MSTFCNITLTSIFAFLAAIHLYWAFGGNWAKMRAVPTTKAGVPLFYPSFAACFTVGIIFVGLILLVNHEEFSFISQWLSQILLLIASTAFLIRTIGDFRYVGFFKRKKQTTFARLDRIYYSPLCLIIVILIFIKLLTEY